MYSLRIIVTFYRVVICIGFGLASMMSGPGF